MSGEGEALASVENALRGVIGFVLSEDWQAVLGAERIESLRQRRDDEGRRRVGSVSDHDLLDFTEMYDLDKIIINQWERFKPAFDDKKRTEMLLGLLKKYRNSIAHSRPLLSFERDLVSGASGLMRNQVAIFINKQTSPDNFYARLDRCVDNFGHVGDPDWSGANYRPSLLRVQVGDKISFDCSATNPGGGSPEWHLGIDYPYGWSESQFKRVALGSRVRLSFRVEERHVGETLVIYVAVRNTSPYHKNKGDAYDGMVTFVYSVNPPLGVSTGS